jgi:hypothetical protein
MSGRIGKHFAVVVFVGLTILPSSSQSPPSPPSAKSVNDYLEVKFKDVLQQCNVKSLTTIVKGSWGREKEVPVSNIPLDLQGSVLPLQNKINSVYNESLGRTMAAIILPAKTGPDRITNDSELLYADLLQSPEAMLPQGIGSVIHRESCSSMIAAAASASSGIDLPLATIKGGLQGQFSSNRESTFALVEGTFRSPFAKMYSSPSSSQQLYARLLLWDWLRTHQAALSDLDHYRYVDKLEGIAVYEFAEVKSSSGGSFNLNGSVSAPYVSVESSIKAALSSSDDTKITSWATFVYDESENPHLVGLPNTKAIVSWVASNARTSTVYQGQTVLPGVPLTHYQTSSGIPAPLCQDGIWRPKVTGTVAGSLVTLQPTLDTQSPDANGMPTCRIPVQFTYSPSVSDSGSVSLAYSLESLIVAPGPVTFNTDDSPYLSLGSLSPDFHKTEIVTASETEEEFDWTVPISVRDTTGSLQRFSNLANNLSLTCPSSGSPFIEVASSFDTNGNLSLGIKNLSHPSESLDLTSKENCTLSGTVTFTMGTGAAARQVQKQIPQNVILQRPSKKALGAAVSSGNPGTTVTPPNPNTLPK